MSRHGTTRPHARSAHPRRLAPLLALTALTALACEPDARPEPPEAAKPAPAPPARRAYEHVGASPLVGLELEAAAALVADAFATQINPFYALGAALHANGPVTVDMGGTVSGDAIAYAHTFEDPMRLVDCLKDPAITRSSWGPPRRFGESCEAPRPMSGLLDTPRRFNTSTIATCAAGDEGAARCCELDPPREAAGSLMLRRVCMSRGEGGDRWKITRLETYGRW